MVTFWNWRGNGYSTVVVFWRRLRTTSPAGKHTKSPRVSFSLGSDLHQPLFLAPSNTPPLRKLSPDRLLQSLNEGQPKPFRKFDLLRRFGFPSFRKRTRCNSHWNYTDNSVLTGINRGFWDCTKPNGPFTCNLPGLFTNTRRNRTVGAAIR